MNVNVKPMHSINWFSVLMLFAYQSKGLIWLYITANNHTNNMDGCLMVVRFE